LEYEFARIRLADTTYTPSVDWQRLDNITIDTVYQLNSIYRDYCVYKQFRSVMPIFDSEYYNDCNDVIGYYHNSQLVAFSLMRRYDNYNVASVQFAWNYTTPQLRLGIESLKTECAIYRDRGFQYLYLDYAHEYKKTIQGFEILGPAE
jgi:hypothetical protein